MPEIGKIYEGLVRTVKEFGAFVQLLPGTDGMVHISELAPQRVEKVPDILKERDKVKVKVIEIDGRGRIRLIRKACLAEEKSVPNRQKATSIKYLPAIASLLSFEIHLIN